MVINGEGLFLCSTCGSQLRHMKIGPILEITGSDQHIFKHNYLKIRNICGIVKGMWKISLCCLILFTTNFFTYAIESYIRVLDC